MGMQQGMCGACSKFQISAMLSHSIPGRLLRPRRCALAHRCLHAAPAIKSLVCKHARACQSSSSPTAKQAPGMQGLLVVQARFEGKAQHGRLQAGTQEPHRPGGIHAAADRARSAARARRPPHGAAPGPCRCALAAPTCMPWGLLGAVLSRRNRRRSQQLAYSHRCLPHSGFLGSMQVVSIIQGSWRPAACQPASLLMQMLCGAHVV